MTSPPSTTTRTRSRMFTGPTTGALRIDPLAGTAPSWRPDADEAPIFDQLVAELGDPFAVDAIPFYDVALVTS